MIEPTQDWDLIKKIVTDKSVYDKSSDDYSPMPQDWEPPKVGASYLLAKAEEDVLGLFALFCENSVCFEVHVCLLPNSYGGKSDTAFQELIAWAFQNTLCRRIIGKVPEYNRLALRFAQRAGLKQYGFNEKSYLKNGKLYGQILLGISKEETCL